ncbi:hypothetical protein SDRG_14793 [Saprolegnia diclina VS20]|uniref:Uncharacterized protein n=1 Tax=Saprolegnia diclina (strain VS20) TaxID=1156394 RepID=T0Q287_SAPDV|nr:hypothetical protein SDRG_14793 [Saprolegnia diclina VS20]EQC27470.1 hypothetical protein SDRG_14793 [Saprolegnia diclina VS20]|eukprot:XP_008619170.1 hypothetical protein SDRG_14793 [Saprolegnia diclina VS20]
MDAPQGPVRVDLAPSAAIPKDDEMVPSLTDVYLEPTSTPRARSRLGFLFEPFVTVILPIHLQSFACTSAALREAASGTFKVIMHNLSAHGVKLILPPILLSTTRRGDPNRKTTSKMEALQSMKFVHSIDAPSLALVMPVL